MKEFFSKAYATRLWGGGSGTGSKPSATATYRKLLQRVLTALNPRTVLDAGCGDWQIARLIDWGDRQYIGIDIVPDVIGDLNALYRRPGVEFRLANIVTETLLGADLLIIKDVMQHWTAAELARFVTKMRVFPYVLATNDVRTAGVKTPWYSRWQPVDLAGPPHHLKATKLLEVKSPKKNYPDKVTTLLAWGGTADISPQVLASLTDVG